MKLQKFKGESQIFKKTNTKQVPPTINPSNIVLTNCPTLINQLKDWQLRQNNLIIYNIPETELVNQQDIKTDLLSKFKKLITYKYNLNLPFREQIRH